MIACGAMTPELLDTEIAETSQAHRQAVRRQPHHHAPAIERADRRLRQAPGHPCRARRRASAGRRDRSDQGQRRQADLLRPGARAGQETDALGRRRLGDRGDGGRRPYRPGLDLGPGAGNPAARRARHPGVRRRRDRPRRSDRGLSRNGRGRGPARHPLRLRDRMHRPRQFQEGLHPRLGPRRDPLGADRPAPAGDPGARAQEPGDGSISPPSSARSPTCSTRARSKWPRPSSRSSIIGPARCAAR